MSKLPLPSLRGSRLAAIAAGAALWPLLAAAAPAAERDGASEAMPRDWVMSHTCGHLGSSCDGSSVRKARLRLRIHPARAAAGRRTVFRVRVEGRGRRAVRAVVSFDGRRVRTDRRGRAVIVARPTHGGRIAGIAHSSSSRSARAYVRVVG